MGGWGHILGRTNPGREPDLEVIVNVLVGVSAGDDVLPQGLKPH